MNCRLNKLKANTPTQTNRERRYNSVHWNFFPKNIRRKRIPGIRGRMILYNNALIKSKNDVSNIQMIYLIKRIIYFAEDNFH